MKKNDKFTEAIKKTLIKGENNPKFEDEFLKKQREEFIKGGGKITIITEEDVEERNINNIRSDKVKKIDGGLCGSGKLIRRNYQEGFFDQN